MSQNTLIAKALKRGWLSPLRALKVAGTMKLSTRVGELEKAGMKIQRRWAHDRKTGKYWKEYRA